MTERVVRWVPAAVTLPIIVAVVVAVAHGWTPVSDRAGEMSRIADVGTRQTPLVGPYSREGWSHPGPLLFWACAPAWRLFGTAGVMATVGLINAGAAALATVIARRIAGPGFALAVAAILLMVEMSIGPAGLVDVWNPYVGTIALVTGLLALAAVVRQVDWALPVAVLTLSWAVQAHVGPAPTVATAGLAAGVLLVVRRRLPARRWLVVAVVVGALAWSGPAVDQATGDPGNLSATVSALATSDEPLPALATSLRTTAAHLGLIPTWARGDNKSYNQEGRMWTLLVPAAGLALTGLAARRRDDRGLADAALIVGVSFASAVVATTRVDLVISAYLYRWTWAVGALSWAVIGVGLWRSIAARVLGRHLHRAAEIVAVTVVAAALAASVAMVVTDEPVVPGEIQSDAATDLLGQVSDRLPREGAYVLASLGGPDWSSVAFGFAVALRAEGFDIMFSSAYREPLGDHLIVADDGGRERLEVVATTTIDADPPERGAVLLATHDPLTTAERGRVAALEAEIRDQVGDAVEPDQAISAGGIGGIALAQEGADPDTLDALDALTAQGFRYTVWLVR